ncbi:helix-turn-helix domain-containing protein [Angustibacter aerolatus]
MDRDSRAVVEGLAAALADSGLTQAELATALGTSPSRFSTYRTGSTMPTAAFYLRALRLAAGLRAARSSGWMTPQSTVREVRQALRDGDAVWALKLVLQARDHVREVLHEDDAAADAWHAVPRSTGSREWDALLAALVEHEFVATDREPPRWTEVDPGDERPQVDFVLPSLLLGVDEIRATTPTWLAAHGVFAAERDLTTA